MKKSLHVVVLAAILASGCGSSSGPSIPSSEEGEFEEMDMQDAAEYADRVLDETLAAITPSLEWTHSWNNDGPCPDDPRDLPYDTGYVSRDRAILTIVSEERRRELLESVRQYWEGQGFVVTGENTSEVVPAIYASAPGDFRMSVGVKGEGQVYLGLTTPCFEMSDVAPPASGPEYTNRQAPRPNVHSDYWSQ
ncbi:hypothetical protein [Streptomyces mayteni]